MNSSRWPLIGAAAPQPLPTPGLCLQQDSRMATENNSDSLPRAAEFFPFLLNPNNHMHPGEINGTDEPSPFLLPGGESPAVSRGNPAWRGWQLRMEGLARDRASPATAPLAQGQTQAPRSSTRGLGFIARSCWKSWAGSRQPGLLHSWLPGDSRLRLHTHPHCCSCTQAAARAQPQEN